VPKGIAVLATLMAAIRVAERAFIAVGMIAMSVMFFINVAVREISPNLATELAWIEEATLFALAWLVFVGLGLTLERRRHIAMTVFQDRLPRPITRAIGKVINLTGLVFCIFLAKIGFDLAVFIFQSGQISPTLGISMVGLYAPLPIGFVLLGLRYLLELLGVQDRTAITAVVIE
jgi:TRAP-type C4-dicarboxylate transport system, small permease component